MSHIHYQFGLRQRDERLREAAERRLTAGLVTTGLPGPGSDADGIPGVDGDDQAEQGAGGDHRPQALVVRYRSSPEHTKHICRGALARLVAALGEVLG